MKSFALAALAATASASPFRFTNKGFSSRGFYPNTTLPTPAPTARVVMTNVGNIYVADYDGTSFTTTINQTVSGAPSWVTFQEPDLLYAVDEYSSTTRIFKLDLEGNTITEGVEAEGSAGVVHLEFNHAATRMVGAGYGAGTIDVWNTEDGGLELIKTITSDGALGPNKERQAAAHPHQANLDPTGRFFAVNDLGTDSILLIDGQDDAFTIVGSVPVKPAGCGPRHGAFYPPKAAVATHYIVLCEIMNLINVYSLDYDLDTINFTPVQTISSLNGGLASPNSTAAAGELVIAGPRDLYVSNRLTGDATDNIAHFSIMPSKTNGTDVSLAYAGNVSSGGKLPRMFSASDDGKDLLVGNQDGALGVAALRRFPDGSLNHVPVSSIDASLFGEAGFGPQFVKQIV